MSTQLAVEDRLAAVEAAVMELQRRLPPTRLSWLGSVVGSMAEQPDFDQVVALGREQRDADRPVEGSGT